MTHFVYIIAFGGNLGDRHACARGALQRLGAIGSVGRQSQWHVTAPMRSLQYDTSKHEDYLNFVFEFSSVLQPRDLYQKICEIEDFFGHDRQQRWLPRAVDLDLLFVSTSQEQDGLFDIASVDSFACGETPLFIPHPEIWQRKFLLDMIESELGFSISILKEKCASTKKGTEV